MDQQTVQNTAQPCSKSIEDLVYEKHLYTDDCRDCGKPVGYHGHRLLCNLTQQQIRNNAIALRGVLSSLYGNISCPVCRYDIFDHAESPHTKG